MLLFGVINASPDSLNTDSIVERARRGDGSRRLAAGQRRRRRSISAGRVDRPRHGGRLARRVGPAGTRSCRRWPRWACRSASTPGDPRWRAARSSAGANGDQRRRRHADRRDVGGGGRVRGADRACRSCPDRTRGRWSTSAAIRSTAISSSSKPASPTPTGSACASAASSIPAPASPQPNWPWEERYRLPEDRLPQPRPAAPVGPAAVHRPAVEGHAAARGADGDRRRAGPRVRASHYPGRGRAEVERRARLAGLTAARPSAVHQ